MYTPADVRDVRLLAEADETGGQLCGPVACEVMRCEYEVFGDARFERLARCLLITLLPGSSDDWGVSRR